jgi:hypothetical protein
MTIAFPLILPLAFARLDFMKSAIGSVFRFWCSLAQDMKSPSWGPQQERLRAPPEKSDSYFDQYYTPTNSFLDVVLSSHGSETSSLNRRVTWFDFRCPFSYIYCFYHFTIPLACARSIHDIQIILFSVFHALHTITKISE